MLNKKELIKKIELFDKLDIKYILELLQKSKEIDSVDKRIELTSDISELVRECLSILVEIDDIFIVEFQKALDKLKEQSRVGYIDRDIVEINRDNLYIIYLALDNSSSTKALSLHKKVQSILMDIDNIHISLIGDKIKNIDFMDGMDGMDSLMFDRGIDRDISIGEDNFGTVITGDNNTVIHHTEIDLNKKLEEELNNLSIGNMIFNTPQEMFFDETKEVTLRISKDIILINDLPKENQTISKQIKISSYMKAVLQSHDFDIMALNSEEQIVDNSTSTEWKWDITPKVKKEKSKIYLRVTVRIPLSEIKEVKKDIPVFKREIKILLK